MQFLLLIVIRGKIGTPPVGRGSKMKSKICEKIALLHLCYLCAFSNLGGRGAEVTATCLGDTLFMGTKKDKRYACLLHCISTTLSFKFLFMFCSPFQGSLKFFFTYEQCMYVYFYFFSFHCLFLSFEGVRAVAAPFLESVGRTLLIACYRSLSPTYPLQPLLQIG